MPCTLEIQKQDASHMYSHGFAFMIMNINIPSPPQPLIVSSHHISSLQSTIVASTIAD